MLSQSTSLIAIGFNGSYLLLIEIQRQLHFLMATCVRSDIIHYSFLSSMMHCQNAALKFYSSSAIVFLELKQNRSFMKLQTKVISRDLMEQWTRPFGSTYIYIRFNMQDVKEKHRQTGRVKSLWSIRLSCRVIGLQKYIQTC